MLRILTYLFFIILITNSPALGVSVHVKWGYTPPNNPAVTGFKLYQEGIYTCQTTDPKAIEMDCNVTVAKICTAYTLTATFLDGTESAHSSPAIFDISRNLRTIYIMEVGQ